MRHRVGIAVVIVLASFFLGACSQQPALGEALDGSSKDVSDAPQTEGGGDPVAADSQLLNLDESIRDPVAFYSGDSAYLDDPGEQEITRIPTTDNESPIIFSGRIEEMNPEFWLIAGHHVRITDETEIIGDLSIGDLVKVHGFQRESVIVARVIKLLERPPQDRVVEFKGRVQELGEHIWLIGDHRVRVTEDTEIHGEIRVGDYVLVQGYLGNEGLVIARVIKLLERSPQDRVVEFRGRVMEMGDRIWLIGDHRVRVTEDTEIHGEIRVGDYVLVQGFLGDEGLVIARVIKLLERPPQDRVVEFKGRVMEMGDRIWLIGDHRVRLTEYTVIQGDIEVGDYVRVLGIMADDGLVVASEIKLLEHGEHDGVHNTADRDDGYTLEKDDHYRED